MKLPEQSASGNQSLLTTMTKDVAATPGVASVTPATVNQAGTTAVFSVIPATRPQAAATEDLVNRRMVWLILAVVIIALILLTTAFPSVVSATKAAILNLLSIGAAYDVIVAIFQWEWGRGLIGVHTTLPIPAYVPMLAFAVLIDASLVRMILVPSVMALLDARAWWMPRWLEPVVPHLQLEGSAAPAAPAAPEPQRTA